ncbi:site-specific integrase [Methylobacterium sp. J-030]|uniref:site-specific integrase n=1 Tax=Methylobacterium sp. J-030 TaxID=2836627 RepID=UPI001FB89704|nr:site-specific integrase [Methylobacterium sp. J-030]MCJ2071265.1 site-specific integrase [Methylobacterium sp. J-030]
MPAATVKLTKRAVDAMVANERRYVLWDAELKGFGVRVEPSGAKSFILRYRAGGRGSAKRFITLGKYGVITPEEARRSARDQLGLVARGSDPAKDKARQKAAATIADVAQRFLAEHVTPKRKAATIASYRHALMARIVPEFGLLRAEAVTRADVARLHSHLSAKPATANYVLAVLSSLYSWCDRQGLVPEGYNPVVRVDRYRQQGRERYLTSEELQRLGNALHEAESVGLPWTIDARSPKAKHLPRPENRKTVLDPGAIAAIRLLILTGARLREILHLRWQEIDFERSLAFLPDSKTGRKTLTLSSPALVILRGLPRTASPFVVAGSREGRPRADLQRPWAAICRSADLPGVRLHDLRHTFASIGAGESLGLPIVGKLLGHTQPQTTARYAHLDANPLRQAADLIASRINKALNFRPSTAKEQ